MSDGESTPSEDEKPNDCKAGKIHAESTKRKYSKSMSWHSQTTSSFTSQTSTKSSLLSRGQSGSFENAEEFHCTLCGAQLGKRRLNPRHHCRICKSAVCGMCSPNLVQLKDKRGINRACNACVTNVQEAPVIQQRLAEIADLARKFQEKTSLQLDSASALQDGDLDPVPRSMSLLDSVAACEEALAGAEKGAAQERLVRQFLESNFDVATQAAEQLRKRLIGLSASPKCIEENLEGCSIMDVIATCNNSLGLVEAHMNSLQAQNQELTAKQMLHEAQLAEMRSQQAHLREKQELLDVSNAQNQELTAKQMLHEAQLAEMRSQQAHLREQQELLDVSNARNQELTAKQMLHEAQLAEMRSQQAHLREQRELLDVSSAQNQELTAKQMLHEAQLAEMRSQIDATTVGMQTRIDDLQTELDRYKSEIEEWKAKEAVKAAQLADKQAQLDTATEHVDVLLLENQEQLKSANTIIDELQIKEALFSAQIAEQNAQLESTSAQWEAQLLEKQRQLDASTDKIAQLYEKLAQLDTAKIQDQQQEIDVSKARIENLMKERETMRVTPLADKQGWNAKVAFEHDTKHSEIIASDVPSDPNFVFPPSSSLKKTSQGAKAILEELGVENTIATV